jgi:hypothetical protein
MNLLHGTVLVLMCMIILFNIKLPSQVKDIGEIPLTITLLFVVFYLFTQSPILGVIGLIVAYEVTQTSKTRYIQTELPNDGEFTPQNQFQETLEEYLVKRIVPLIQTQSPVHLNFKNNMDNTHNASTL